MLNNGVMWVDTDGKITAVNTHNAKEQALTNRLIEEDKRSLHVSVNAFEKPLLKWNTAKYHVRIDDLGDHNFRYTSWTIDNKPRDKPEMILLKGAINFEGSGGNHHYIFENGRYSYVLQVTVIGSDGTPGWLEIYKDDKLVLSENAENVN